MTTHEKLVMSVRIKNLERHHECTVVFDDGVFVDLTCEGKIQQAQ